MFQIWTLKGLSITTCWRGKPFTFTTEESRVQTQINLLMTFSKSGGQLGASEDYWTQVGIAIGHSAAIADFNWSPPDTSVSKFGFSSKFHYKCGIFILQAFYAHYDCFLSGILFCLGFYHLVNLWALRLLSACHIVLFGHKRDVVP